MLCEESHNLINTSITVGYASKKYANGWEYFCKYKGNFYYVIDDGTDTHMIADSKPVKISEEEAITLVKEIVHDKQKQINAFRMLGINSNDTYIQRGKASITPIYDRRNEAGVANCKL